MASAARRRSRRRFQEARIIATRLGPPPKGYANLSLRLLARTLVELEIVDTVSSATLCRMLKNGMTNRKMQYRVIPPEVDAEFVAHMEDVLETYAKPYDPSVPVLCMDEQPVQLVKHVKTPLADTKSTPQHVDYEYERSGVANVFKFTEPLSGWREVAIREQNTKVDLAPPTATHLFTLGIAILGIAIKISSRF